MLLALFLMAHMPLLLSSCCPCLSPFFQPKTSNFVSFCVLPPSAILTREQRRVWFADGVLPNGDTAESSRAPAADLTPSQPPASTYSNKSSTPEYSEVRLLNFQSPLALLETLAQGGRRETTI